MIKEGYLRYISGITETEGLLELRYKLTSPKKCSVESCKGYKFSHLQDENMRCTDYQEIKIQVYLFPAVLT